MKILFIGDIVSDPGRLAVKTALPEIKNTLNPDIVIANAENLTQGRGVTKSNLDEMLDAGVDYFTGGDHIFWQRNSMEDMPTFPVVIPANYPEPTPGNKFKIFETPVGKILIMNLMGRTSFGGPYSYLEDPFRTADKILKEHAHIPNLVKIIDFHGDATSEKYAFGFYVDGRVDAVVGTHTHVPTCDNRILPSGTAFVTDVGMAGNIDSVLGVKTEIIQKLFLTAQNQRFEWENTGKIAFRSVIIDTDRKTIERVDKYL